ncbi:MAG: hypothetical protein K5931_01860 [Lachnospiraceae bacterium]|nr:hypothetical protein [Lachnospiraceae bacterium]
MNRFSKQKLTKRLFTSANLSIIVFLLVILLFIAGINYLSGSSLSNEKEMLENALNKDIVHCYAIEGIYPPSLSYIESHYGLTYDHDKYIISYEPVASNIMPSVMVIEKNLTK